MRRFRVTFAGSSDGSVPSLCRSLAFCSCGLGQCLQIRTHRLTIYAAGMMLQRATSPRFAGRLLALSHGCRLWLADCSGPLYCGWQHEVGFRPLPVLLLPINLIIRHKFPLQLPRLVPPADQGFGLQVFLVAMTTPPLRSTGPVSTNTAIRSFHVASR